MNHKQSANDPALQSDETAKPGKKTEGLNFAPNGSLEPEYGGPKGLEPTRYGDWERKGRCVDF